jgi:molybdenum cofactor cytidylyltransferase
MISAVVLAAGLSSRMGKPKINLPWADTTILGQVVRTLGAAGVDDIVVVTGGTPVEGIEDWLGMPFRLVPNLDYASGEMLSSLHVGVQAQSPTAEAMLVALGDMPAVPVSAVQAVISAWTETHTSLVIPSFKMRRGHPWLVGRSLWPSLLDLQPPDTLRSFLNQNQAAIQYVNVESPGVLLDLDTPGDYENHKPC